MGKGERKPPYLLPRRGGRRPLIREKSEAHGLLNPAQKGKKGKGRKKGATTTTPQSQKGATSNPPTSGRKGGNMMFCSHFRWRRRGRKKKGGRLYVGRSAKEKRQ